jgi:hypothetical protein
MRYVEEDRGHVTPCWIYQGYIKPTGYGLVTVRIEGRKTSRNAHVAFYETEVGPVPEGYELDHLCKVRSCIRPDHLEPVTHLTNVLRSSATRLTDEQVRYVLDSELGPAALARELGITREYVWALRKGKHRVAA